jgi:hypothetical protein
MTGIITSLPPLIEQPPGNASSNPAGLPGVTYTVALLGLAQTWTATQTFPLGMISLNVADVIGAFSLVQLPPLIVQNITAPGPVNIAANADVVEVNQTVGAPITLTMPAASSFASRTGGCLISDYKGDSGTNKITINLSGSDKFPGNQSSWAINGDTGSITLWPIPGVGYAL